MTEYCSCPRSCIVTGRCDCGCEKCNDPRAEQTNCATEAGAQQTLPETAPLPGATPSIIEQQIASARKVLDETHPKIGGTGKRVAELERECTDLRRQLAEAQEVSTELEKRVKELAQAGAIRYAEMAHAENDRQYHMDAINHLASFLALSGTSYEVVNAAIDNLKRLAKTMPCGHPESLRVSSVESDVSWCDLCDTRNQRNDAVMMERYYQEQIQQLNAAFKTERNAKMLADECYERQCHRAEAAERERDEWRRKWMAADLANHTAAALALEQAAKMCETVRSNRMMPEDWQWRNASSDCAAAIRSLIPADARETIRDAEMPKVVCLCGSTRFKSAFDDANYQETMAGRIVLSVGFFMHVSGNKHGEGIGATPEQKIALDVLHKRKIDLCDDVLVLNVGGYIGESTRSEINYAIAHGKPIRYLESIDAALAAEGHK